MKTILFLDIDGVLSIPNIKNTEERKECWPPVCWPVPIAYPLLRAIEVHPRIQPVWMTAWDFGAWDWNDRANTKRWSVGYHLSKRAQTSVAQRYPEYQGRRIDGKLLAVRWFLRQYPRHQVVWIEDGFSDETHQWAKSDPRIRLVDTWPMDNEVATYLLKAHVDLEKASRDFLQQYVLS